MFLCPQCDTPLSETECACGFQYRQPQQQMLPLELATQRKTDPPRPAPLSDT